MQFSQLKPDKGLRYGSCCTDPWCYRPRAAGTIYCERHARAEQSRKKALAKQTDRQLHSFLKLTHLYAIQCKDTIKIGVAYDVAERLSSMQTGNPDHMELLAYCKSLKATEKELHKFLAPFRHHGEWFRDTPEVRAVVERIKAGEFEPKEYIQAAMAELKARAAAR